MDTRGRGRGTRTGGTRRRGRQSSRRRRRDVPRGGAGRAVLAAVLSVLGRALQVSPRPLCLVSPRLNTRSCLTGWRCWSYCTIRSRI